MAKGRKSDLYERYTRALKLSYQISDLPEEAKADSEIDKIERSSKRKKREADAKMREAQADLNNAIAQMISNSIGEIATQARDQAAKQIGKELAKSAMKSIDQAEGDS